MDFIDAKSVCWDVKPPPRVARVPAQLSTACRAVYWQAAKEFYSGSGAIIDGGALVGGTSVALLEGWKDAGKSPAATPFLHAFDLFKCNKSTCEFLTNSFGGHWSEGDDFLALYEKNIEAYKDFVVIYPGDLRSYERWDGPPIEIFGIDIWKNELLAEHSARVFFPNLALGAIVLHQDYKHAFQPHIHRIMEALSANFEKIHETNETEGTVVFQLVRPLEPGVVEQALVRSRDRLEARKLAEMAADRAFRDDTRLFIQMADCLREANQNGGKAALAQLEDIQPWPKDPYMSYFFSRQKQEIKKILLMRK